MTVSSPGQCTASIQLTAYWYMANTASTDPGGFSSESRESCIEMRESCIEMRESCIEMRASCTGTPLGPVSPVLGPYISAVGATKAAWSL